MRPLVIDEEAKIKLQTLKEFAERNPLSVDDLLDIHNKSEPPVGDREGFSCEIPFGFRIVFSVEPQPKGPARHLSISVDAPNRMPNPVAVQLLMQELGFDKELEECYVYFEDKNAVNIIEYI